jgi:hypothetical protein
VLLDEQHRRPCPLALGLQTAASFWTTEGAAS